MPLFLFSFPFIHNGQMITIGSPHLSWFAHRFTKYTSLFCGLPAVFPQATRWWLCFGFTVSQSNGDWRNMAQCFLARNGLFTADKQVTTSLKYSIKYFSYEFMLLHIPCISMPGNDIEGILQSVIMWQYVYAECCIFAFIGRGHSH